MEIFSEKISEIDEYDSSLLIIDVDSLCGISISES